jgi:hypothetical protein
LFLELLDLIDLLFEESDLALEIAIARCLGIDALGQETMYENNYADTDCSDRARQRQKLTLLGFAPFCPVGQ